MPPTPERKTTLARAIQALLVGSALACALVVHFVFLGENGTLADFGSDHTSHMSSAILFTHVGFDLYRHPIEELCPGAESPEGCTIPGRKGRALHINWAGFPRPYPPGALLYAMPEALLWAWTPISRRAVNQLAVIKFVFVTHVLLWLVFLAIARGLAFEQEPRVSRRVPLTGLALTLFFLVTCEALRFSFFGIYDAIALLAVFLAITALRAERPVDALLAMSAALFLHFRALWFAPVVVFCVTEIFRTGAFRRRDAAIKLTVSTLLLGASAFSLVLVFPSLTRFPDTNLLHSNGALAPALVGVTTALCLGVAAWKREWLLFACVLCQGAVLLRTPQIMPWHAFFLLPFLVVGANRSRALFAAAATLYFVQATWVFNARPQPRSLYAPLMTQLKAAFTEPTAAGTRPPAPR